MPTAPERDSDVLTRHIIGAAVEVHRHLGAGLLESAYEACLAHELGARRLAAERQAAVPLRYKDVVLDIGFRADLVVERQVLIEVKSVERLHPVVDAQILTYLKLLELRTALLINFNVPLLKDGVRRISL